MTRLKSNFISLNDFASVDTVIFGCVESPPIVNLVILLYKQYITSCKLRDDCNTSPTLEGAIQAITSQHRVEEVIAKKTKSHEQFEKKWEKVITRSRKHISMKPAVVSDFKHQVPVVGVAPCGMGQLHSM